jgi:hypothetical protein
MNRGRTMAAAMLEYQILAIDISISQKRGHHFIQANSCKDIMKAFMPAGVVEEVASINPNVISAQALEDFKALASDIMKVGTGDKYVVTCKISLLNLVMTW